jgi:hypothetical protein
MSFTTSPGMHRPSKSARAAAGAPALSPCLWQSSRLYVRNPKPSHSRMLRGCRGVSRTAFMVGLLTNTFLELAFPQDAVCAISAAVVSWSHHAPGRARRHQLGISQRNEESHRLPRTRCTGWDQWCARCRWLYWGTLAGSLRTARGL